MIELVPHHRMRLFVYVTLSVTTLCALFAVFRSNEAYLIALNVRERMVIREAVANEYVPRLVRMEQMYTMHETIMQGMMVRQKEITSDYLKILKGR